MKYITADGGVWKVPEIEFKQVQREIKKHGEVDLNRFGKLITTDLILLSDLIETERNK